MADVRLAAAQPIDFDEKQAAEKAALISTEDLQREILAQLYLQNHHAMVQNTNLGKIKGHLTFYTFMLIASFVLAIAMFGK